MKCSQCKKRPATLHVTQVINGKKSNVQICDICAANKGYLNYSEETYSLHDLLKGLFNFDSSHIGLQDDKLFDKNKGLHCSKCDLTFDDFQRTGKFGCSQCYESFKSRLEPIFRRVHSGNTKHHGKIPKRQGKHLYRKREIEHYRNKLQKLIAEENFERAAVIRDEIKRLEAQTGEGGRS